MNQKTLKTFDIEKHTPFINHIWTGVVDTQDYGFDAIADYITKQSEETETIYKSNVGGWQSDSTNDIPAVIRPLMHAIHRVANNAYRDLGIPREAELVGWWSNLNKYKDTNVSHVHPFCFLSGCVYIKSPDPDAKTVFERPDDMDHYLPQTELTESSLRQYRIPPDEGRIVLFPAYMRHSVEPNMTHEDRISIAFNFR